MRSMFFGCPDRLEPDARVALEANKVEGLVLLTPSWFLDPPYPHFTYDREDFLRFSHHIDTHRDPCGANGIGVPEGFTGTMVVDIERPYTSPLHDPEDFTIWEIAAAYIQVYRVIKAAMTLRPEAQVHLYGIFTKEVIKERPGSNSYFARYFCDRLNGMCHGGGMSVYVDPTKDNRALWTYRFGEYQRVKKQVLAKESRWWDSGIWVWHLDRKTRKPLTQKVNADTARFVKSLNPDSVKLFAVDGAWHQPDWEPCTASYINVYTEPPGPDAEEPPALEPAPGPVTSTKRKRKPTTKR
ncbi:MAG: hypothetical protein V3S01_02095 [Dehalococcoidia bacterium]